MANLAAKSPDYDGPDVETRMGGARGPKNAHGRPSREWIKKRLNQHGKNGDAADSELVQILEHQVEVAKSWDVRIVGRGADGEPIKVASGRDSTEAAKFVYGLIGLKPMVTGELPVTLPADLVTEGRSLLDIAADIYRHRLISGEMTESEFGEMVRVLLSFDKAKVELLLKLMGKSITGKTPEEVRALMDGKAAPPAQLPDQVIPATGRMESPSQDGLVGAEAGTISASPPAEGTEVPPSTPNANSEAGTTSDATASSFHGAPDEDDD